MQSADSWSVRDASISLVDPVVMGILNVTPDSFSGGGIDGDVETAVEVAVQMANDGAAIIDVGGESTRPGASLVALDEELARVLPVVERLSALGLLVSIDTSKAEVASKAISAGAVVVNDVTGLSDPKMRAVCAEAEVGVVAMHMQGTPRTMQRSPHYEDVVHEIKEFLIERAAAAVGSGISPESIVIDPGIGFGKTFDHNIELMQRQDEFCDLGYPVLVGTSRKGFLGTILEPVRGRTNPDERDGAGAATIALSVAAGVRILRVHNVPLAVDVARSAKAMVPQDDGKETNRT